MEVAISVGRYPLNPCVSLPGWDTDSAQAELLVTPTGLFVLDQHYQSEDSTGNESISVSLMSLSAIGGKSTLICEDMFYIDADPLEIEGVDEENIFPNYQAAIAAADVAYRQCIARVLPNA